MDHLFLKLVGGILLFAIAIVAFVYIGTFFITVVAGLFGLVCVKTKYPIVSPHGFIAIPFAYAVAWAAAITIGLALGGALLNEVRNVMPYGGQAVLAWKNDALPFFVKAVAVLFAAARFRRRARGHGGILRASIIVSTLAAAIFSIPSGFLEPTSYFASVKIVIALIFETYAFPIQLIVDTVSDPKRSIDAFLAWLATTNGNLFKLSPVIAKILWIYALYKSVRGTALRELNAEEPAPVRSALTSSEWLLFVATMVTTAILVAIVWLDMQESTRGVRYSFWIANPFMTFFLAYIVLWFFLWLSRNRGTA